MKKIVLRRSCRTTAADLSGNHRPQSLSLDDISSSSSERGRDLKLRAPPYPIVPVMIQSPPDSGKSRTVGGVRVRRPHDVKHFTHVSHHSRASYSPRVPITQRHNTRSNIRSDVAVASGYLSPVPTSSVPIRSSGRRRMKKNLDIPDDLSPRVFHPSVKLKKGPVFDASTYTFSQLNTIKGKDTSRFAKLDFMYCPQTVIDRFFPAITDDQYTRVPPSFRSTPVSIREFQRRYKKKDQIRFLELEDDEFQEIETSSRDKHIGDGKYVPCNGISLEFFLRYYSGRPTRDRSSVEGFLTLSRTLLLNLVCV